MCSRLDLETPSRRKAQQEFRDVERLTGPSHVARLGRDLRVLSLSLLLSSHMSGIVMCPLSLSLYKEFISYTPKVRYEFPQLSLPVSPHSLTPYYPC